MFDSHEIDRLYSVEKWRVVKIADDLSVSRVTIIHGLRISVMNSRLAIKCVILEYELTRLSRFT